MQADNVLQVTPESTASANMATGTAMTEFDVTTMAQPVHAVAATTSDAVHAASMWGPTVAANATTRHSVTEAAAALAKHWGAVADRNDQSLTKIVETDYENTKDLTAHPVENA